MSPRVITDFYSLLSTSPDGRHTFVCRTHWGREEQGVTLYLFNGSVLLRQWDMPRVLAPGICAWNADGSMFALARPPRVVVYILERDEQLVATCDEACRGVFFGVDGTLIAQGAASVTHYEVGRTLRRSHVTQYRRFGWVGGHYAIYGRGGNIHLSSGRVLGCASGYFGSLGDAAQTCQLRISPAGDYVHLIHWSAAATDSATIVSLSVADDEPVSSLSMTIPHRSPTVHWTVGRGNSLLQLHRQHDRIHLSRCKLGTGDREDIGSVEAAHASFLHGVDDSLHLFAELGPRKTLLRVDEDSMTQIMTCEADICALQATKSGVRALISADRDLDTWSLSIDGCNVLREVALAQSTTVTAPGNMNPRAQSARRLARSDTAGVIYIPALFAADRFWSQSPFFQHVLFCLVRALNGMGLPYIVLESQRGTARDRNSLVAGVAERLSIAFERLRTRGCQRIGIVAGSLGGFALLHNLEFLNRAAAAILLSPVHDLNDALGERFGFPSNGAPPAPIAEDLSFSRLREELLQRAEKVSCPTYIAHGVRDEVSPSLHSSIFMSGIPSHVAKQYLSIPDEGHVFKHFDSWERVAASAMEFSTAHLVRHDSA